MISNLYDTLFENKGYKWHCKPSSTCELQTFIHCLFLYFCFFFTGKRGSWVKDHSWLDVSIHIIWCEIYQIKLIFRLKSCLCWLERIFFWERVNVRFGSLVTLVDKLPHLSISSYNKQQESMLHTVFGVQVWVVFKSTMTNKYLSEGI